MKKIKNLLIYSIVFIVTLFSMIVPYAVNGITDYYRENYKSEEKPDIAKIGYKNDKLTKSEVANLLLNSDLTETSNRNCDISEINIKENIINIFSEVYGEESEIFKLYELLIKKSGIIYAKPRYSLLINDGQVIIFEVLSVFLDCGIDITYEMDSLILISFSMNNNYSYPEIAKLYNCIYESLGSVKSYYEDILYIQKYNCEMKEYEGSESYFFHYYGFDYYPENKEIYINYTEYDK